MFLTCSMCKHSTSFPQSEGAVEDDLYKCRKDIPAPDQNRRGDFPVVHKDWECNNYQKEMGT